METLKLDAADRGLLSNSEFKGFALFNNGQPGTNRLGNFGPLYVFNDDILYPESGLGMHPHANVEIVTVMISGEESHNDTLGIHEKYTTGDVQLISAGSGIYHAGGNTNAREDARHLQIWIKPREYNTPPQVKVLKASDKMNSNDSAKLIVSPNGTEGSLIINQKIWITELKLTDTREFEFVTRENGLGIMIYAISGRTIADNEILTQGDTLFRIDVERITLIADESTASLILIETTLNV
jgi:redox-sensitive bicupin YhaK (pirin superfamily)